MCDEVRHRCQVRGCSQFDLCSLHVVFFTANDVTAQKLREQFFIVTCGAITQY